MNYITFIMLLTGKKQQPKTNMVNICHLNINLRNKEYQN